MPHPRKDGARSRYQRCPRAKVRPRKRAAESYHARRDAACAALVVLFALMLVWGFGAAYQAGFQAAVHG